MSGIEDIWLERQSQEPSYSDHHDERNCIVDNVKYCVPPEIDCKHMSIQRVRTLYDQLGSPRDYASVAAMS